jgi:hypothetical protein
MSQLESVGVSWSQLGVAGVLQAQHSSLICCAFIALEAEGLGGVGAEEGSDGKAWDWPAAVGVGCTSMLPLPQVAE